nr:hypothetical protein CFP56_72919 [Quercus suber]
MPLLSNVMVIEGATEISLKGVGKIVSVCDKSLTAGVAEIGSSMLGLDGIETVENVKQILSKVQKLEGKMDAGFQRMDHKIEEEPARDKKLDCDVNLIDSFRVYAMVC